MAETEALNGAESQLPLEQAMALEEEERREEEERKKAREPPIVYKDAVDVRFSHLTNTNFTYITCAVIRLERNLMRLLAYSTENYHRRNRNPLKSCNSI